MRSGRFGGKDGGKGVKNELDLYLPNFVSLDMYFMQDLDPHQHVMGMRFQGKPVFSFREAAQCDKIRCAELAVSPMLPTCISNHSTAAIKQETGWKANLTSDV